MSTRTDAEYPKGYSIGYRVKKYAIPGGILAVHVGFNKDTDEITATVVSTKQLWQDADHDLVMDMILDQVKNKLEDQLDSLDL